MPGSLGPIWEGLKNTLRRSLPPGIFDPLFRLAWRLKAALAMRRLGRAARELRAARAAVRPARPPGVNLIGPLGAETGLGESARLLARALEKTSEPLFLTDSESPAAPPHDINLIHVNPVGLLPVWRSLGREAWAGRYNIGFWLWELEKFPAAWRPAFGLFDEIWTPSEFVARAIRKETRLPVTVMPYGLALAAEAPAAEAPAEGYGRAWFGLPEGVFLFLAAADSVSVLERKNPLGAAEAFTRAFPPGAAEEVGLILKIRSVPRSFRRRLEKLLAGYRHIFFLERSLSRPEVLGLIKSADAFVSLHRAEGFGLVLAEAMCLGTPCVATAWSANTEFMPPGTAGLVEAEMAEIRRGVGPFPKGGRWAEPDLAGAARLMRELVREPGLGAAWSAAAAAHVRSALSLEAAAARLAARLAAIRKEADLL